MENLKTLKERLKPEILANIEEVKDTYPLTYKSMMEALEENVAITQLTLETINSLSAYSPKYIDKILDIYDMFEN